MDYYAIAFCAQLHRTDVLLEKAGMKLGPFDFVKYFYNILIVVFIQMSLLLLVFLQLSEGSDVTMVHFDILVSRFFCAVLLHVVAEPEVY